MEHVELIATAAFGLEAIVEREVQKLGFTDTKVEDGRVRFKGDLTAICKANLWLRTADRVQLVMGEFHCPDFEQLFERTKEMPWEEWLGVDAKFPVYAKSVKSMLTATPSVQRAVKKAIVERLKTKHNRIWFDEEGPEYAIEISLLNDRALLTIDTSGEGLHKRGYRQMTTEAPLKETLAAALIQLSYWNRDRVLVDPFCGSGTIPIEAAMIARNMPPGGDRSFVAETWPQVSVKLWTEARKEARDLRLKPLEQSIIATDMDPQVIRLARKHANDAGVGTDIHFERKLFAEFKEYREYGCMICNPPYGERMGDREAVDQLNEDFGEIIRMHPTWSFYCLTAHPMFERLAGQTADRRRKLYNGRIECTYYQYQGPRPPREAALAAEELEASVPPPPLDFRPLKPPTRGPAAGKPVEDFVATPGEDPIPGEGEESRATMSPFISTAEAGLPPALINRMKTLDFRPLKPPLRGPYAKCEGASAASTDSPSAAPVSPDWSSQPVPRPPLDFKPNIPPLRGPLAQATAVTPTERQESESLAERHDSPSQEAIDVPSLANAPSVPGEAPATETPVPVAHESIERTPALAVSPPPVNDWSSRPIPPPPLDFKPLKPPTRGPMVQGGGNIVSKVPPLKSAAAFSSRPIPAPPLDFKPNIPPLRGPLAPPKTLAEMAAAAALAVPETVTAAVPVAVRKPEPPVAAESFDTVMPEVVPPAPVVIPPTVEEVLAPTPLEPVRPPQPQIMLAVTTPPTTPAELGPFEGVG